MEKLDQEEAEREREKRRENRRDEKGKRAKIERRLWLWTTDHQRGLDWPMGPTTGATWLDEWTSIGAPGEKNSPERNHASAHGWEW